MAPYSRTASSPHHLYRAILPPFCPEGPYLVLPVSGSTTLRMTLCLASHSSFVIGFIAWMRDFCSSVRTGRCPLVRAVLERHRSVPAMSSQEHSTRSLQCLWVSDKPHQRRAAGWPQSSARLVLLCPLIWCLFFHLTATIRAKNSPIYVCSSLLLLSVAQRQQEGGVRDCSVHSSATTLGVDPTKGTRRSFSPLQCSLAKQEGNVNVTWPGVHQRLLLPLLQ